MTASSTRRRKQSDFGCSECGWSTPKWVGRCAGCGVWGSVVEAVSTVDLTVAGGSGPGPVRPIAEVSADEAEHRATQIGELDRVLGGGVVPGSVVLVAGEPGVGKSTLLLDVAARSAQAGSRALYVSGEESAAQVRARAGRIGALADDLFLAAESDLAGVLAHVESVAPSLLVLDSVQTVSMPSADGAAGGVAQVREVTAALVRVAKARAMSVLLVGHVTKDGAIAGPRTMEHLVDVVLSFEGDRHSRLRLLRALKNRFGPADEVGCFDLGDDGLTGLADASSLFVNSRSDPVPGTCVTVAIEGRRPLVAEVQALVAPSPLAAPRRATSGLDTSRTAMVLAVLERRAGVRLADRDVFAATVGGLRLTEPAADLALSLAVASAAHDLAVRPRWVAFGEVGLTGEVRQVQGLPQRLAEAARLGFEVAIVPSSSAARAPEGMRCLAVPDVLAAVNLLRPGSSS